MWWEGDELREIPSLSRQEKTVLGCEFGPCPEIYPHPDDSWSKGYPFRKPNLRKIPRYALELLEACGGQTSMDHLRRDRAALPKLIDAIIEADTRPVFLSIGSMDATVDLELFSCPEALHRLRIQLTNFTRFQICLDPMLDEELNPSHSETKARAFAYFLNSIAPQLEKLDVTSCAYNSRDRYEEWDWNEHAVGAVFNSMARHSFFPSLKGFLTVGHVGGGRHVLGFHGGAQSNSPDVQIPPYGDVSIQDDQRRMGAEGEGGFRGAWAAPALQF